MNGSLFYRGWQNPRLSNDEIMANLFDTENAVNGIPLTIAVDTFTHWRVVNADYPNGLYSMQYVVRLAGGTTTEFFVNSTIDGQDFLFTLDGSEALTAGSYDWQLFVTQNSSGYVLLLESGSVKVIANLNAESAEVRDHASIMLDKIESILEGKADSDVQSYSIAGRSLTKISTTELIEWRDYYRKEFLKTKNAEAIKKGEGTGTTIKVRF